MKLEWIKVDDKLPSKRQAVLFTDGTTVKKGVFMLLLVDKYNDFDNVFLGDDDGIYLLAAQQISHWMPIPGPPKL